MLLCLEPCADTRHDLDAWFDANRDRVREWAQYLLGEEGLAEDAVQETYLRAVQALDRFDAARSLQPWIRGILRRVCQEMRRRRQPVDWMVAARLAVSEADALLDEVAATLAAAQDQRQMAAAWQQMTPMQRWLLEAAYLEEMPAAEVAATLGCSLTAAKMRLSRARQRLRRFVQAAQDDMP